MTAAALNVTGLALDIASVVVLFWWAPEKFPDPQATAFFAIEDDSRDRWRAAQIVRKRLACRARPARAGFGLQMVATILPES